MRKIAIANQKGGVGKTTTVINLAGALARLGLRTLVVDIDPQGNATLALGVNQPQEGSAAALTICDVLRGDCRLEHAIVQRSENLEVLPSHIDLAALEGELLASSERRLLLRDALTPIAGYDYVLLDCPPSLGLLNVNALAYASEILVPLQCEFFALQGISLLMRTVNLVKKRLNPALEIGGVLACMFDGRRLLAREVLAEIEKFFGKKVFRTHVRTNVKLAESPSHGKTIFEYAPKSKGDEDYMSLAREVAGISAEPGRLSEESQTAQREQEAAAEGPSDQVDK